MCVTCSLCACSAFQDAEEEDICAACESLLLKKEAKESHPNPSPSFPPPHSPPHSKAKGFEVGCELGYYKACCQTWLAVLRRVEKEEKEEAEEENGVVGLVMDTTTKER